MRAKEYLTQYETLGAELSRITSEITALEAQIGSNNVLGDGTPHGSGVSDKTGRLASELADIMTEYSDALARAWQKRAEIVATINEVADPVQSSLLYAKYIQLKRWHEVAEQIHMNEVYTRGRLHGAALRSVDAILAERSIDK